MNVAVLIEDWWWVIDPLVIGQVRVIDLFTTLHRSTCHRLADRLVFCLLGSNRNVDLIDSDGDIARLLSFKEGLIRDIVWPRVGSMDRLGVELVHVVVLPFLQE
jgi:hypothetical protein